ncbi:Threonyl/alanyl tRNA synthetase SAD [Ignicoccus pacificus DSM 13166]|uniref:Threonyl/alanyl tRNA synthetase SAD n=1 Tax=Ignicoccus pacificus DSM 13166 TaxID=940294 RepID=A0A977K9W7_9CREN|nr:Threonyl/alanyl tRNA synthetase SAD [Ignicoccus pacificus DSM 13166]
MTELIYYKDPYVKTFEARVVKVLPEESAIVLDRTAFYPESGGQPYDTGRIVWEGGEAKVVNVQFKGDEVYHYLEGALPPEGSIIKGEIDWDRRYKLMRSHTLAHLLMAAVNEKFREKVPVVGSGLGLEESRMDFKAKIKKDDLKEIDDIIRKWVEEGREVKIHLFEDPEEAKKLLDSYGIQGGELTEEHLQKRPIRIIEIVGVNADPCGGTHLKNTKEVGEFKLVKRESKGKGVTRIRFKVL